MRRDARPRRAESSGFEAGRVERVQWGARIRRLNATSSVEFRRRASSTAGNSIMNERRNPRSPWLDLSIPLRDAV